MNDAVKTVALLLFDGVLTLDVCGPADVFSIANRYLPPARQYRVITLSAGQRSVKASNGMTLTADHLLEEAGSGFHLLLVPGGPGAYDTLHEELNRWLACAAGQAQRYGAICTGAFILGEAGLLDGRRVTTHWNYVDRLARRFPTARVELDQIYLRDRNLVTSGGVTAGIDMALSVVADDHGNDLALEVAKVLLVVFKRQGDQRQFGPLLATVVRDGSAIAKAQAYVVDHIEEAYSVDKLAGIAAMSPRNFARTFQREVQLTPMEYVQNARVDYARKLLENSELPLKTVAANAGFGSARHMRHIFGAQLGLTPTQYRRRFGAT